MDQLLIHNSWETLPQSPKDITNSSLDCKDTSIYCLQSKPKRGALSAYSIFFQHERQKILRETTVRSEGKPRRSHGKIGFAPLARNIANRWRNLDTNERKHFEELATKEKARYKKEMDQWKKASKEYRKFADVHLALNSDKSTANIASNGIITNTRDDLLKSRNGTNLPPVVRRNEMPHILELAAKLDHECVDFLSSLFL